VDDVRHIAEMLPREAARRTRIVFLGGKAGGISRIGDVEVFYAGFVTDIYSAMAGLDLIWHPAHDEGLGTALIDALALGVPPVAFAVGGVPEIVRDGREGLLIPHGDIGGFVRAHISTLNSETRRPLAAAGPSRAALFSVERMTENTERVYERVLTV
jgi:glycosyltransferase involved in cell wall biosynthesis